MDPTTQRLMGGAAGGAENLYIENVFSTWLYTGTGSTQTITNGIDLSGKGGLIWLKARSATGPHYIWSSGVQGYDSQDFGAYVGSQSDLEAQKYYNSQTSSFPQVSSTGFTTGFVNSNTVSYASWTFRKAKKFFDIVTYTGNGSNRAIAHNLGSVPGCIIVKRLDTPSDWRVYHRSTGNLYYLTLNSTAAQTYSLGIWNAGNPSSSFFFLGGFDPEVNASGGTYVAYLFAHDAGGFGDSGNESVIKCGSFTTNSSQEATVTLGWEPQFVLIKNSQASDAWRLYDTMRGASLSQSRELRPNTSEAEYNFDGFNVCIPTATGFTVDSLNESQTHIYIAIRRGPMKTPTTGTSVFNCVKYTKSSSNQFVQTNTVVDAAFISANVTPGGGYFTPLGARLTAPNAIRTSETLEEYPAGFNYASNIGFTDGSYASGTDVVAEAFSRAPGFFDVVAYTGTGSARTVAHNLGVMPELILVKSRSASAFWRWYWAPLGATRNLYMPNNEAAVTQTEVWNDTAPTSTVFTVGTSTDTNFSARTYIAYLFATCPGISKVGSYTGTGTTLNIDCGFTSGARFVLIKRTDSTGDWYVWDTARGIVSGNDPYLLLNSTAAEVTNTDYIDPLSSGFQISSTAPAAINANGGSFIYLAIA